MIIPRIVFGLLLFQLTMCGLFAIKSFYILSILCVPIMVATCIFKYVLDLAFSDNGKNMPMQLLRNNMDGDTVSEDEEEEDIRQGDGNPGTSSETIVKGDSANSGVAVNTIEMARKQAIRSKWKNAAINAVKLTAQPEAEEDAQLVRPRHVKLALDEDDYEATPNKFTDYRQPPMRLNPGLLDTGLKTYGNPLLVGVLPQLWLPVKKLADGEAAKSLPEGRRLSDGNVVKEFQNSGGVAQQLAELLRNIEEKRASPMGDSNNDLTTTGRPQMDGSGDLRREARETAHSDAASIVEGRNTRMNALRELFHRKSYKSSHLHPDEDHLTENDNTSSNTIDLEEKGKADDHGIPNERPRAEVAAAAWKKLHKTYYHHKRTKDAESSSSPQTVPDVEKTDSIDLTTLPEQENTFPQAKQVDDLTSIPLSDHQDDEK
jgi:hypothetical protein